MPSCHFPIGQEPLLLECIKTTYGYQRFKYEIIPTKQKGRAICATRIGKHFDINYSVFSNTYLNSDITF